MFDLTGQVFGRLTVVSVNGKKEHHVYWLCRCQCGVGKSVRADCLTRQITVSCTCQRRQVASGRMKTHGLSRTPAYGAWKNMHQHCYDKKHKSYPDYGGRGIIVCDLWHDFDNFFADMGQPPKGMMIERIRNNEPYSLKNCRWAIRHEQMRNKRNNRPLRRSDGVEMLMADWAKETDIAAATINKRLKRGWSIDDALSAMNCYLSRRP